MSIDIDIDQDTAEQLVYDAVYMNPNSLLWELSNSDAYDFVFPLTPEGYLPLVIDSALTTLGKEGFIIWGKNGCKGWTVSEPEEIKELCSPARYRVDMGIKKESYAEYAGYEGYLDKRGMMDLSQGLIFEVKAKSDLSTHKIVYKLVTLDQPEKCDHYNQGKEGHPQFVEWKFCPKCGEKL